jgi:hypothetical protein
MNASDNPAAIGYRRTHSYRHRPTAYKRKQENKSVPRTRKEKCQKVGHTCRIYTLRGHQAKGVWLFHRCLRPVSIAYAVGSGHLRLTLLTFTCQKCQTGRRRRIKQCTQTQACRGPPSHHYITPLREPLTNRKAEGDLKMRLATLKQPNPKLTYACDGLEVCLHPCADTPDHFKLEVLTPNSRYEYGDYPTDEAHELAQRLIESRQTWSPNSRDFWRPTIWQAL